MVRATVAQVDIFSVVFLLYHLKGWGQLENTQKYGCVKFYIPMKIMILLKEP